MKKVILLFLTILVCYRPDITLAGEQKSHPLNERLSLYVKMETMTQIPWYVYAAVDQYEHQVRNARKDRPDSKGSIGIYFTPEKWAGPLNPNPADTNPITVSLFGGVGLDGNNDGKADINNDEDLLFTFANHLQKYGSHLDDIKIGLWDYYQRDQAVRIITSNIKLYKTFGTLKLDKHAFPVPLRSNYSYRSTWGDRRGWGGLRMHEGTDIFADYGVPVRATSYGTIETKGWNRYGGWRIGLRDLNGTYHYYAHLNGFEKNIKLGDVVKPGDVIGYVGSSGYGPKGTSGKFPPHLHYGMYKDNGVTEWSYDPYYSLRLWERQERIELRKNR
ncbi:M23 family metallopeptidase [Pseudalkalibacillus caeni]|uniref:Peptidase M23 n=1 Tax=Exobacillus caeni TaxID=2574798 RepID=A0A5R9FE27_9BACL|nr:M23 family metallopeptidase [Pseudalkalibacillus caeni]TLS38824.1 peptidase M23 [Pseudalkalibacillus caeni]